MNTNENIEQRIEKLMASFGNENAALSPTADQWRRVLERPPDKPITLVNLFKLNEKANYADEDISGKEAFDRYAKVSVPKVAGKGGKFLLVASFEGMFLGEDENWDLVAIGQYPNTAALLSLFEDEEYQAVMPHRIAACAKHKVYICSG
jgi:uncharacterized protein (DUF1330 family)